MDFHQLFAKGKLLSKQESDQLESAVESNSSDIVSRIRLLGYYRVHPNPSRYAVHMGWLIDNRVDDDVVMDFVVHNYLRGVHESDYDKLKVHWLKHINSDEVNPAAMFSAAEFFILNCDFDLASICVQKLETCNLGERDSLSMATVYEGLGNLAEKDHRETLRNELLYKAVDWCEKAAASDDLSFYASMKLVELLFVSKRFARLKNIATEVLKYADKNFVPAAYAVHVVNLALGKVALAEGDLQSAVGYLAASIDIPGYPSLLSATGPDLTLAAALLEKGEKTSISDFLSECDKFVLSDSNARLLQYWKQAIAEGRNPASSSRIVGKRSQRRRP